MIVYLKFDFFIKEFFFFFYDVIKKLYLKYFKFLLLGEKFVDVEIFFEGFIMMYDFVIIDNLVIIFDQQVVFKLQEMVFCGGFFVVYDNNKMLCFGVFCKDVKDVMQIIWVEFLNIFCFYFWNVWEERENDEVVVIGLCMILVDFIFNECDENENFKSVFLEIWFNF